MKDFFKGFAAAAVLVAAFNYPVHAEDASPSTTAPPSEAKPAPADVPRPALVPKATDATQDTNTDAPRHQRRYARHHYRHYAYWEPFPVYFPHLYRNRIVWNRISWFRF